MKLDWQASIHLDEYDQLHHGYAYPSLDRDSVFWQFWQQSLNISLPLLYQMDEWKLYRCGKITESGNDPRLGRNNKSMVGKLLILGLG